MRFRFSSPFCSKRCGLQTLSNVVTLLPTINETLKWLAPLPVRMQKRSNGDGVESGTSFPSQPPPGISVLVFITKVEQDEKLIEHGNSVASSGVLVQLRCRGNSL